MATTPAAAKPAAKVFGIWTDVATLYAFPADPLTLEEDAALAALVLEYQPAEKTMEIALVLLAQRASNPNLVFLPYPWVKAALEAKGLPTTPLDIVEEEEEEEEVEDDNDNEEDN